MTLTTSRPLVRRSLLLAALGALTLAASLSAGADTSAVQPASAAVNTAVRSTKVDYRDLDVTTERGSRALYQRLNAAAHDVCRVEDQRDLAAVTRARQCEQHALSRAVQQVHSERVAALHWHFQPRS